MVFFAHGIDFILHVDKHLADIISRFGLWTYLILCLIIFCETGLVVTPFLPGDSLLFAAGALCASTALEPLNLFFLLAAATIAGDNSNYWIGYHLGPKVFRKENVKLFNRKHLLRTQQFYERYGAKTIVLARFVPIVRTFAPFVAGIGRMRYVKFVSFSLAGGMLWVGLFIFAGYRFGNIPTVQHHFTLVILAIILISLLPPLLELAKHRWQARTRGETIATEKEVT